MPTHHLLMIGAGRMAQAIVSGLTNHPEYEASWRVVVANRENQARLAKLRALYNVDTAEQWQSAVWSVDVVLLAVPPSEHRAILRALGPLLRGQLVVSVAAGIGVRGLEEGLPPGTPVAWVMPNTAADVGESMSIYATGAHFTRQHQTMLEQILDGIGKHYVCTEPQVEALTAITGSAPAFVYRFAAVLEDMAAEFGINDTGARQLVGQMLYGSAAMLMRGAAPMDLANQVTTPGGATAAGLDVLSQADFDGTVRRAIDATNQRARDLAQDTGE